MRYWAVCVGVFVCAATGAGAQFTDSSRTFNFPDRGGVALTTDGSGSLAIGYALIQTEAGAARPSGLSVFTLRQGGVVVAETSVPATPLVQSGRVFAETRGSLNTALAFANPNSQPASVSFFLTDSAGIALRSGSFTIPANGQLARFISEPPFTSGEAFAGTFTYTSALPIALTVVRTFVNERSEFLMTPLPFDNVARVTSGRTAFFPHFADGGGWTTEVILVNSTDNTLAGTVQFFDPGLGAGLAAPLRMNVNGQTGDTFPFTIAPRSFYRLQTAGSSSSTQVGSVRATSNVGGAAPSGVVVTSNRPSNVRFTEVSIPSVQPTSATRLYAEADELFGIRSGVALTNPSSSPATANLELTSMSGVSLGTTTVVVPAFGQAESFLNAIPGFGNLPPAFQALLRVSTDSPEGVSVIGLRRHLNERAESLFAAVEAVPENTAASADFVFPQIADGNGFSTQLVLLANAPGRNSSGALRLLTPSGATFDRGIFNISSAGLPSLQLVYPDVVFPGTTMPVTLSGSGFIPGRTRVTVNGGGMSVGSLSQTAATSLDTTLAAAAVASLGERTITVTTSGGTSNPATVRVVNVETVASPSEVVAGRMNVSLSVNAYFESIHRYWLGGVRAVQFAINGTIDPGITPTSFEIQGNQITTTINVGANVILGPHTIVLTTPRGNVPSLGTLLVKPGP